MQTATRQKWIARIAGGDGGECVIEAGSITEARKLAEDWARDGDYGEPESTIWVRVDLVTADGEIDSGKITIDPAEPKCTGGGAHDWQTPHALVGGSKDNPGVWGHGGGVYITEACVRCGCARRTDTWAQDRSDGEQGLTSVRYEPGAYALD